MSIEIRASSLPKLAECPLFEAAPGSTDATSRGIFLDAAFRAVLAGNSAPVAALQTSDDRAAVWWAVEELRSLAEGKHIETDEAYLAMAVPGLSTVGTADAKCDERAWVADLKTGQIRNYREQMAAYCLACMEDRFAARWEAHVLYCDQRVRRSYAFTYEEAAAIVQSVVNAATAPDAKPRPCEYCDWCARKDSCAALVRANTEALAVATSADSVSAIRDRILSNPETVAEFARQWKRAEKDIAKPVMERLRELAEVDAAPGWKLTQVKGREYFDHVAIVKAAQAGKAGLDSLVLAMGGTMSGEKFRAWCADLRVDVDESLARVGASSTQLRQTKTK
mgnify:CR=1 FL=1